MDIPCKLFAKNLRENKKYSIQEQIEIKNQIQRVGGEQMFSL